MAVGGAAARSFLRAAALAGGGGVKQCVGGGWQPPGALEPCKSGDQRRRSSPLRGRWCRATGGGRTSRERAVVAREAGQQWCMDIDGGGVSEE
jgi:hypothetical protein